ncbi:hypothetical protein M426DRAFT_119224 [Hypoxylon sp. CI-4A]|nr:hypothetical protein M426DRAFT_119224 [Hypoxylon sp. CI-4A]
MDPDFLATFYNRPKDPKPAPEGPQETQTFKARCHCGNIAFSVTLATAALPLNAHMCSCSLCRYTHGTYASFHVALPQGVGPEWTSGSVNMTVYKTPDSGPGGHGQRWFCPTCGAHNGHYEPWAQQWIVSASLFDGPAFWSFVGFGFPRSAADGGISSWLPRVGGKKMTEVTLPRDPPPVNRLVIGKDGEERVRAECNCGGVSFTIPRPSDTVRRDPYMGQYVSPKDPRKWKAFLDICRDCQRVSGAQVHSWMLVPRKVLEPEIPADLNFGTLKVYQSSDKVKRGFCGKCGATVLIKTTLRSPTEETEILNIAMGILRAPEGARAENWVTWRAGNPAWVEDGMKFDPEFVSALVEGQKNWALEKYGEALDFDIIYDL